VRAVEIEAPADASLRSPLPLLDGTGAAVGNITSLTFDSQRGTWLGLGTVQLTAIGPGLRAARGAETFAARVQESA
jgi:hypothetical protein